MTEIRTGKDVSPVQQLLGGHLVVEDGHSVLVHCPQTAAGLDERLAQVHVALHVRQQQR